MFSADLGVNQAGTPPPATDPQFNLVTALLHGDGTNGAQNNTFTDSSSNAFTITRTGNVAQGTFSPFSLPDGQWSNYFDGSGDYLSFAAATALNQSGNFTIEAWIYLTATPSATTPIYAFEVTNFMKFAINTSRNLTVDQANVGIKVTGSTALNLNTWYHMAFVRSGSGSNNCKIYLNGVQEGQFTDTTTCKVSGTGRICSRPDLTSGFLTCYLSNLRVTNTAVYTSAFTPPTTPLTAVSGTSLLTCQSNRFKDNSSNNFTITPTGDTKVTAFSPFLPSAAYDAATNGGSGYFDGAGDYLSFTGTNTAFQFGTGDFTVECWVYIKTSNTAAIWDFRPSSNGPYPTLYISGGVFWYVANAAIVITGTAPAQTGTWYHVAIARSGTSTKMFVNGVQDGSTYSDSTNYTVASDRPYIGNDSFGLSYPFDGYISNLRMVKGTALYTTTFTPPTAPLTAISGTSLLLNCVNAGIYDNAAKNDIETVGNAQISTSVKKYGTGSMAFDGSGDYLVLPANTNLTFGTGDFTVEAWVYLNTTGIDQCLIDFRSTTNSFGAFYISGSGNVLGFYDGSVTASGSALSANTWYHVAYVRSGTTLYSYLNGVNQWSRSLSTNITTIGNPKVGADYNGSLSQMNGYIDDLRITKGYARYTSSFTPPTQAFPNQ